MIFLKYYRIASVAFLFFFPNINTLPITDNNPPSILHLHFKCPDPGGIESHLIGLNKIFNEKGIKNIVLTSKYSTFLIDALNQPAQENGKSCRTFDHPLFDPINTDIQAIYEKDNVAVIVSNWPGGLNSSVNFAEHFPVKLVYMHHNFVHDFDDTEIENLNKTNGILAVSPIAAAYFKELSNSEKIQVKNIEHMAPFWDEDKYLTYQLKYTKKEFFKNTFNLDITDDYPIICSVANLYWYKNHQVLIKALGLLHHKDQTKFHLILAGDGPERKKLEQLTASLKLTNYVHFIGKTLEVPELLYHADLHVLPSSHESFGLVHLEAATMKKPFVGATKTGAEGFIQQGITGFIFENNNAQDLAEKLKILLNDSTLRKTMGEKAFTYVRQHYANKVIFDKWVDFLGKI